MFSTLLFLSVFSVSLILMKYIEDFKLGYALLTSFCINILLSYVFIYLFNSYVVAPILIVFVPIIIFLGFCIEKKKLACVYSQNKSTIIIYAIFCFIFVFLFHDQGVWYSDETTFWARAVQELHVLKESYFNPFSNMHHKDYYPAFIPFQYAYTSVFNYSESTLYYINSLSILLCLIAITETFKRKSLLKNIAFISFSLICLSVGYPTLSVNSLLIDIQLAIYLITALILIFLRTENGGYQYAVVAMSFTIIFLKSFTGLLFCAIIVFALIFSKVFLKENVQNKLIAICLTGVVLLQCSWSIYYTVGINHTEISKAILQAELFDDEIEQPAIDASALNLFFSNPRTGSIISTLNNDIAQDNITLIKDSFNILYKQKLQNANTSAFYVLLCLITALLAYLIRLFKNKFVTSFFAFTSFACLTYIVGIAFTYLIQPEIISSLLRYFAVVLVILTIALFKFAFEEDKSFKSLLIVFICLFVFNPFNLIKNIISPKVNDTFEIHKNIVAEMSQYSSNNEKTLLIYGIDANQINASESRSAECEYFFAKYNTSVLFRNEPSYATSIDYDFLNYHTQNSMSTKVVMNFYTEEYIEAVSMQLNIDPQTPMPWILKVEKTNGKPQYTLIDE